MRIREYLKSDHQSCIDLFNGNCPEYFDPSEEKGFELWLDGLDSGQISYKNVAANYFYVIEKDNKLYGCGGFYIFKDRNGANMAWGMIDKEYHLKGLGKQLLEFRIAQIKIMYPQHSILLDTSQHTYKFFEKLGFKIIKLIPDGYGDGLHRYDMEKLN